VVTPVGGIEIWEYARVEAHALHEVLPEDRPDGTVGRFEGRVNLDPLALQLLRQAPDLGRFSRAVDPFEDDEFTGVHEPLAESLAETVPDFLGRTAPLPG
jgi:hypothetical protein